jgi:hypothetical protein
MSVLPVSMITKTWKRLVVIHLYLKKVKRSIRYVSIVPRHVILHGQITWFQRVPRDGSVWSNELLWHCLCSVDRNPLPHYSLIGNCGAVNITDPNSRSKDFFWVIISWAIKIWRRQKLSYLFFCSFTPLFFLRIAINTVTLFLLLLLKCSSSSTFFPLSSALPLFLSLN